MADSLRTSSLGWLVQRAGYDCIYAGKWHVHTASMPDKEFGFSVIHPHNDNGLAESAVAFLEQKHSKPFFLVVGFDNPHNICEYARSQNLPFGNQPELPQDEWPGLPQNFARNPYDADVIDYEQTQNYSAYPTRHFTPDDWRRYRSLYFRLVKTVDAEIGKIVDAIDIPLIVTLPGKKNAGKELPQLVNEGVDFFASVCDWAGVALPEGLHGVSFKSLVENADPKQAHQSYVVTETTFDKGVARGWALRTDHYKYVLYDKGLYREQLYDMDNDRGEMRNLAIEKKYREVLLQHRAYLNEWMKLHRIPQIRPEVHLIPDM